MPLHFWFGLFYDLKPLPFVLVQPFSLFYCLNLVVLMMLTSTCMSITFLISNDHAAISILQLCYIGLVFMTTILISVLPSSTSVVIWCVFMCIYHEC